MLELLHQTCSKTVWYHCWVALEILMSVKIKMESSAIHASKCSIVITSLPIVWRAGGINVSSFFLFSFCTLERQNSKSSISGHHLFTTFFHRAEDLWNQWDLFQSVAQCLIMLLTVMSVRLMDQYNVSSHHGKEDIPAPKIEQELKHHATGAPESCTQALWVHRNVCFLKEFFFAKMTEQLKYDHRNHFFDFVKWR